MVENAHTVRDLHATVLHLLGLDRRNLICRFGGRDYRLTDVDGHPIRGILASRAQRRYCQLLWIGT